MPHNNQQLSDIAAAIKQGVIAHCDTLTVDLHATIFRQAFSLKSEFGRYVRDAADRFESNLPSDGTPSDPLERLVPKVCHKIWITSKTTPALPPQTLMDEYCRRSPSDEAGWASYFWTNSAALANTLQDRFLAEGLAITVASTDAFCEAPAYKSYAALVRAGKFALAADIMKIIVLKSFGGLYTDLGMSVSLELKELITYSNYTFLVGTADFFQLSLLASAKESQVLSAAGLLTARPEIEAALVPAELGFGLTPVTELSVIAGPGFSSVAILFTTASDRVLMLPPNSAFHQWSSARSWYEGAPKFGNVPPMSVPPSILSAESNERVQSVSNAAIETFGDIDLLAARLRFLLPCIDYFEFSPTPLCKMLSRAGSDKAMSWHNYAPIYYFILRDIVGTNSNIVEIGIGTNNTDVPSSMGEAGVPGASLRAWREFTRGEIVGADIDRRILFSEGHIRTFFVDQQDRETINELMASVAAPINLLIDDGLHQFQANVNVAEVCLPFVRDGCYLIVEDVLEHEVPMWREYLGSANLNAAMVHIPHHQNKSDNRLIIIRSTPENGSF